MEEEIKDLVTDLNKKAARVTALLEFYKPEKFPPSVLNMQKTEWLAKVETAYTDLMEALFILKDFMDDAKEYDDLVNGITAKVNSFTLDYTMKILDLNTDTSLSRESSTTSASVTEARKAAASIAVDVEKINLDTGKLSEEIKAVDVEEADDHEVSVVMGSLGDWSKRSREIQNQLYSVKKLVMEYSLDEGLLQVPEAAVAKLSSDLDKLVEDAKYEDSHRCLFSLSGTESSKVPYPSFSGGFDEDFSKFVTELEDVFKSNKVRRADKVKMLRGCLKGFPKTLVPENTKEIETALGTLDGMYGDVSRVMNAKMDQLKNLGKFPKPGSKTAPHLRAQIQWLLEIELLLGELVQLSTINQDLYCEVFKPSTMRELKSVFPYAMCEEMAETVVGDCKKKMEMLQIYIVGKRKIVQKLLGDTDTPGIATTTLCSRADRTGIGGWDDEDEDCVTGSLDLDPNDPDDYFFLLMMSD